MSRRRRKSNKNNNNIIAVITFIIVVIIGVVIYTNSAPKLLQEINKTKDLEPNDLRTKEEKNNPANDNLTKKEEEKAKEEQKKEEPKEYKAQTQTGEEIKVEANKMITATGFSGASNHRFYLRGTTLYYKNTSVTDLEEEIIATNVKDLYLENKEVTAELYSDGKIVKENNYITYK